MAKKINIIANLVDKQLKKQLADIEKGKYKVNVDVDGEKINSTNKSMKQLGNTTASTNSEFGKLKNTISNTFSTGKIAMTAYLMVLNEINKAGQNAKQTIKELDNEITDLSVATNMSRESVSALLKTYNAYAKNLKSTTVDVSKAADDYIRAGVSMRDSQELIKDSIMLSKLGQIEANEATKDLLSTMNAYEMSIEEVNRALDAMVAVDLKASTSAGEIATALRYCASNADLAGLSFNQLIAIISTIQHKTGMAAEVVGNTMNTVLSRYKNVKLGAITDDDGEDISNVETSLKSLGIQLRNSSQDFRDFEEVFNELGKNWNNYTEVQQASIAKELGGVRQMNRVIAMFEGYNKVLELTEVAASSAGSALDKFNTAYVDSLEAKQATLQASFESMIMNSDFSEVYSGIIDATTALVEFIDKTNALKGVMSSLAVGGAIKGFASIKSGITQAYVTLNKFQNAMNLVKKTKISTNDFQRLLLLSDGLSKSQMKLILSTNTLSVAQKKELLIASGLSEEEAILTLNTWKMSAANNGLTASTTSVGNSLKALFTMIKANPLGLIVTGIGIGVAAWQKYKQSIEEAVSSASDAANTYKEQNDAIDEAVTKYQELRQQLIAAKGNEEETYAIKQQLLELQTELNEKFGIEAGRINLVTDAYRDQTEAIKALNKESGQLFLNENRKGIEQATKQMESDKTYMLGTTNGLIDASELKYLDKIGQIASANNIQRTDNGFEFVGNARDASKSINNFMNQIKELQKEAGDTSSVLSGIFDGILDNSGEALAEADGIIEKYGDIYEQAQLAQIASDKNLSQTYNEATAAVEAYNNAVLESENPYDDQEVQNAWNKLQSVKQEIKDNEAEWGQYSNIVDNVFSEANDDVYSFYQAITNDQSVSKFVDDLKGLTDIDLQAMVDDGDNGDAFDKLCEKAENYGLEIQDVIDLLIQLGVVQGQIDDEIGSADISSKWDYSETISQLDEMEKKFSALDETYSKLFDEDSNIGFEDYSSILDAFKDVEGLDISGYIKQLEEAGQNQEQVQATIQDLIGSYLDLSGILDNVTEENAGLIASFLEEQGIANADTIVNQALAYSKFQTQLETINLTNATKEEIQAFIDEYNAANATAYTLNDVLEAKVGINGANINTASDIEQLIALANAAGVSAVKISQLQNLLNNMNGEVDTTTASGMKSEQLAIKTKEKLDNSTFFDDNPNNSAGWTNLDPSQFIKPTYTGGSATNKAREDAAKSASDKAKDAAKEAEEALTDSLSRIQDAIDELDKEASDKYSKWSTRNDALEAEMGKVQEAIGAQQQLVDFYNSRGDVTKAQEAANAVKDLQRQLKELAQQKLENIKKFNEDIVSLIESLKELTQSYIDIKETRGIAFSEADYNELISKSEEERKQYETELSQLQAQLQENINNGYLEEGSEAWYEWQTELNKIKKSINECTKEQIEWNKAIKKLPLDAIEKYVNAANRITSLINAQQDILNARGIGENLHNISAQLMNVTNNIGNAEGQIREYEKLIRDGFSDDVNGWAKLTEEQVNTVMSYIKDGWDEAGMTTYLASLGIDASRLTELDEYIQKLGDAETSLLTAKKEQIEWNKAIQGLDITAAEKYGALIEKLNSEISDQNTILDARGLSKSVSDIENELHGLASTVMIEQNKINNYNEVVRKNLTDDVNGWANLTEDQLDQVFQYIKSNDHQGLFDFFNGIGINPATLDGFWELVGDIETADSDIASATASQIELNKALKQMDITTYENLNELLEKAKTEIEGLRSLIESHGNTASDNLLSTQIENAMKAIELSKSKINSYTKYIRDSFSDSVSGWASLTQEQIDKIFGYMNNNDTEGLNSYFESLGLSSGTLTEFWEVVGNIRNEENNILSEMVNQEGYFDDMLENRISQLDKIKEQLQKINDAKNKALELEKARYALIEAQNNRNVMTWDGNQMVWTSDSNEVSNALENLNNLEFQALIDSIDDATDAIRDLMDDKNLYDDNGNLLSNWQDIIKTAQTSVTDIITGIVSKLNERGYDIDIPQFGTGGAIKGDKGDNNLIRVADKERVLTPAQNDIYEKFLNFAMDNYNSMMQNMIPSNLTPKNYDIVRKNDNVKMVTYQLNGDFVMPNVHDASKVSDLIKDLESIEIKAQQRVGRIN